MPGSGEKEAEFPVSINVGGTNPGGFHAIGFFTVVDNNGFYLFVVVFGRTYFTTDSENPCFLRARPHLVIKHV